MVQLIIHTMSLANLPLNFQALASNSITEWSMEFITFPCPKFSAGLTHWGRVMHICVNKLTIIGSDNGLLPGRRQAIIWTNNGILLTGPLGTNFSEILIEI